MASATSEPSSPTFTQELQQNLEAVASNDSATVAEAEKSESIDSDDSTANATSA